MGLPKNFWVSPEEVEKKACQYMKEGKWQKAIAVFTEAAPGLEEGEVEPSFYNNWALCYEQLGEYEKALETLFPNLHPEGTPSAFAHALAARLLYKLGREKEALAELRQGIEDFAANVNFFRHAGLFLPEGLREHLIILQEAAGLLGDHRLVLEIHRRWSSFYASPQNWFFAGVAAFNLGRYRQACEYWAHAAEAQGWKFLKDYILMAEEVERGLVPSFPLPYRSIQPEETKKKVERLQKGAEEIFTGEEIAALLGYLLANDMDNQVVLEGLIRYSGAWGKDFARNLLRANRVPQEVKFAVARILYDAGLVPMNQPLEMVIDGRPHKVRMNQVEVRWDDAEAKEVWERAKALRDAGKAEEAERLLSALMDRVIFPPAVLTLANLLRKRGEFTAAENMFHLLEEIDPQNPYYLLNISAFYWQQGDLKKARAYFKRLARKKIPEDLREKYSLLGEGLGLL